MTPAAARAGARRETGATTAEYTGVIVVVAALVAALALSPIGEQVSGGLRQAICSILGQGVCGPATVPSGPSPGATGSDGTPGDSDAGAGGENSSAGSDGATVPVIDDGGCSGFWCTVGGAARSVGGAAKSVGDGLWSGTKAVGSGVAGVAGAAWDDVTGVVDLVRDPGLLVDAGKAIWDDPLGVAGQLVVDQESRDAWGEGDYGEAVGRTIWNVGSVVLTVTKAGKAGKVGAVAGTVDDWAGVAVDARRAADAASEAAKAGDAAKAVEAAAEARRIADEAAEAARKLGCPLAAPPIGRVVHGGGGRGMIAMAPILMADPCDPAKDAARQADAAADAAEDAARTASAPPLTALDQGAAKVPTAWGAGTPNRKGIGTRWTDPANPGNGIRVDQGVTGSPWPSQQVDHVVVRSEGRILGPDGQPIVGTLAQNPQAHIPLSDWLQWAEWDKPG